MANWGDEDQWLDSLRGSQETHYIWTWEILHFYHRYKEPIKWVLLPILIIWAFWLGLQH